MVGDRRPVTFSISKAGSHHMQKCCLFSRIQEPEIGCNVQNLIPLTLRVAMGREYMSISFFCAIEINNEVSSSGSKASAHATQLMAGRIRGH
jgi:hypothetical protein